MGGFGGTEMQHNPWKGGGGGEENVRNFIFP